MPMQAARRIKRASTVQDEHAAAAGLFGRVTLMCPLGSYICSCRTQKVLLNVRMQGAPLRFSITGRQSPSLSKQSDGRTLVLILGHRLEVVPVV